MPLPMDENAKAAQQPACLHDVVRAIAKRLVLRRTASAPHVVLALFELNDLGLAIGDDGLIHVWLLALVA